MEHVRLGKTELMVSKTAFGALPIQRLSKADAVSLVRNAFDGGINYFDTANVYSDSEEKLGEAFQGIRDKVIISTKSGATDRETVASHIETSLRRMKTDYIDLFQFHNPATLPDYDDPDSAFAAALDAKKKGYIRHIGITNHGIENAMNAVASGHYETMQFPFSYLTTQKELDLVSACKEADMGFIAMKGLAGGILNNAKACYAFMSQHPTVVPIWGVQHQWELDQWLEFSNTKVEMTPELQGIIEKDRLELMDNFCRGCGYCLPCPANIDLPWVARMGSLIRRSPSAPYMTQAWSDKMEQISQCIHCNACMGRCPYHLDTPNLIAAMLEDYRQFRADFLKTT